MGFPALLLIASLEDPAGAAETKPAERPRGEFVLGLGVTGGATNWSGDVTSYGAMTLGLRLFGVITPFAQGRLGYGTVDQRMLTFLSLGLMGGYHVTERIYPRAVLAFVHQHEESMAAVAYEPLGATLGIGVGIRHRAGVQFGLGCDFLVFRAPKFELTVGPELTGVYLTYSSGPNWYGLLSVSAGGHFQVF
jgi:hypothetical protein